MNESQIKALVSLITDDDKEVVKMIKAKVLEVGMPCIPFLEFEWERHFGQDIQDRIEGIIHDIQFEDICINLKEWVENEEEDLVKGMWILGKYQYQDISLESIKSEIQQLYYLFWTNFSLEDSPMSRLKKFNDIFYREIGFKPNTKDFHSPNNSMISYVLEAKKGNPISLCVIYMSIAQMLKLPIYGVNLPNLFVLKYESETTNFYINAFNKGMIFSSSDVENYLTQLRIKGDRSEYYQRCSHAIIIRRVIRNLMISYEKSEMTDKKKDMKTLFNIVDQKIKRNKK